MGTHRRGNVLVLRLLDVADQGGQLVRCLESLLAAAAGGGAAAALTNADLPRLRVADNGEALGQPSTRLAALHGSRQKGGK